jgi:hypothetical protein
MPTDFLPTTKDIAAAFADEISVLGGWISGNYDDGIRLFMHAQLAAESDIRAGDAVNAGVALRVMGPVVSVYPYTFRQVCSNGAIAAQVKGTREIPRVEFVSATEFVAAAIEEIRLTVRQCAAPEAFAKVTNEMRRATVAPAELMIHVLPALDRLPTELQAEMMVMILQEFERANDQSLYGVMNAVTAAARGVNDPETKWQLEQYGGSLPALAQRSPRAPTRDRELIAV